MKSSIIMLVILLSAAVSANTVLSSYRFANPDAVLQGDYELEGRLLITGDTGPGPAPDGLNVGMIIDPQGQRRYGALITSELMAVIAHSVEGTGVLATSIDGYGLQAVSLNGTALFVDGRIDKRLEEDHFLSVYDETTGDHIATYRYEFH